MLIATRSKIGNDTSANVKTLHTDQRGSTLMKNADRS
jgi:hypothetical protein